MFLAGVFLCLTIVGAPIGLPMIIFSLFCSKPDCGPHQYGNGQVLGERHSDFGGGRTWDGDEWV